MPKTLGGPAAGKRRDDRQFNASRDGNRAGVNRMSEKVRKVLRPPIVCEQSSEDAGKPTASATEGRRLEKRLVSDLKPYPLQANFFRDLSDAALSDLAENIRRRGLRRPIEILPDGTIVSGHQRLRAVKLLGWTEVTVVVSFDLQEAGPAAAEAYFLEANEIRRQLGQHEHLAVIVRRHELEPKGSQRRGQGEIREIIGAKLGMTGRHVSRMIKLLALPLAIRNAVDDQRITLKDAERCLDLDSQQLESVRHALERGGGVAEIIAESLASTTQTSPASFKIANSIRKQLLRCGRQLARNIAAVAESCGHRDVKALAQIETAVRRLRQRLIGAGQ